MPSSLSWRVPGRPDSQKLRWAILLSLGVLVIPLFVRALSGTPIPFIDDTWRKFLICLIPGLAAAGCFARASIAHIDRLAWQAIGIGLASWWIGAIGRTFFLDVSSGRPVPAWVDFFFLAMYPFVLAGLILLLRNRLRTYRHLAVFDAVSGFLLLVSLAFVFFPDQISAMTGHSDVGTVVLASYPLGDFALLVVLGSLFRSSSQPFGGPWSLFGIGILIFVVGDLIFALTTSIDGSVVALLVGIRLVGFILVLAGSWRPDEEILEIAPGPAQLLPPLIFLVIAMGALIYGQARDLWDAAVVALALSIVLVLARLLATGLEYFRLQDQRQNQSLDENTGLPSRRHLEQLLDQFSLNPAWRESPIALYAIQVDRIDHLEAALGRKLVDELLSLCATRLRRATDAAGTLIAIDRAEFGLLCGADSSPDPPFLVREISRSLEAPMEVGGVEVKVNAVVGAASAPADTSDPSDLPRLALLSCRDAKKARETLRLRPKALNAYRQELTRVAELREAIGNRELSLHFQPKVATTDGLVRSTEALVRWEHPVEGMLPPNEFVTLAEEHGLMPSLTDLVTDMAAAQSKDWIDQGLDLNVAVNLGLADLFDHSLVERMTTTLGRHGIEPANFTLEISEDLVIRHTALLTWNLEALRTADFAVSLDDFGSGTTSLAHLRSLPVDEIKLDRSLVGKMHMTREDAMITESVVSIAKVLGLNVVAEGVEEEATVQRLFQLDCGDIQGFYFSRPLPAERFSEWLDEHRKDGVPFRP